MFADCLTGAANKCPAGPPGPPGVPGKKGGEGIPGENGLNGKDAQDVTPASRDTGGCFHCPAGPQANKFFD